MVSNEEVLVDIVKKRGIDSLNKTLMESIHRIVIVYKESTYSRYFKGREPKGEIRLLKELHEKHFCMVEKAISFFRTEGIEVIPLKRARLKSIGHADLMITIGGDGTFLDTAHFVKDIPMWGINSTPTHSAGFLMSATPRDFEKKWELLRQGKLPVLNLQRLEVSINGRPLPELVLNDLLLAHVNPAAVSRYQLQIGNKEEEQKSSGVWIATATGSTAAIRSAGGKVLPVESKQIQYWVREPYHGRKNRYWLTRGIMTSKTAIRFISRMQKAACYLDGPRVSYPIRYGDRVEVKSASQPLQVIGPIR